jgi:hypothetical protein
MASLSFKVTAPVVLISAFAIGLTVFLNTGKFDRALGEIEASRMQYTLQEIKSNIETSLGLGLQLQGIASAQTTLEFEQKQDPAILSISVYNDAGRLLFHAGQALEGEQVPEDWRPFLSGNAGRQWELKDPENKIVGSELTSVMGSRVGGVAVRYSQRQHRATVQAVTEQLQDWGLIAMIATALSSALTIGLLLRQTARRLRGIERSLTVVGESEGDGTAVVGGIALVASVVTSSRAALQDLERSDQDLQHAARTGVP